MLGWNTADAEGLHQRQCGRARIGGCVDQQLEDGIHEARRMHFGLLHANVELQEIPTTAPGATVYEEYHAKREKFDADTESPAE